MFKLANLHQGDFRLELWVDALFCVCSVSAHTSGRANYGGREHQLQEIVGQCIKQNGNEGDVRTGI